MGCFISYIKHDDNKQEPMDIHTLLITVTDELTAEEDLRNADAARQALVDALVEHHFNDDAVGDVVNKFENYMSGEHGVEHDTELAVVFTRFNDKTFTSSEWRMRGLLTVANHPVAVFSVDGENGDIFAESL